MTIRTCASVACLLVACHKPAHEPASFGELFAGTPAPALTGPVLGGLDWNASFTEAEARVARHASDTLTYSAIGTGTSKLSEIIVRSRDAADPEPELVKLWGPPKLALAAGDVMHPAGSKVWYGDHVAALLLARQPTPTVALVHYVPLAEELGAPKAPLLGFERGEPIIGASADAIAKRYHDVLQDTGGGRPATLALPFDGVDDLHVLLDFDARGVATGLHFYVAMTSEVAPARAQTVLARFGRTSLSDKERFEGFAWNAYHVQVVPNEAGGLWSVSIAQPAP